MKPTLKPLSVDEVIRRLSSLPGSHLVRVNNAQTPWRCRVSGNGYPELRFEVDPVRRDLFEVRLVSLRAQRTRHRQERHHSRKALTRGATP